MWYGVVSEVINKDSLLQIIKKLLRMFKHFVKYYSVCLHKVIEEKH